MTRENLWLVKCTDRDGDDVDDLREEQMAGHLAHIEAIVSGIHLSKFFLAARTRKNKFGHKGKCVPKVFSCRKRETRARKKHGGQYRKFAYQKMQASTKNVWHSFSASFLKCRSQNGREGADNYTEHIRWMVPKLLPGV